MTPEDQKYYETYIDLFASEGWTQFISDLKESFESSQQTARTRCKTSDEWHYERGQQDKVANILAFEDIMMSFYEQKLAEGEDSHDIED